MIQRGVSRGDQDATGQDQEYLNNDKNNNKKKGFSFVVASLFTTRGNAPGLLVAAITETFFLFSSPSCKQIVINCNDPTDFLFITEKKVPFQ